MKKLLFDFDEIYKQIAYDDKMYGGTRITSLGVLKKYIKPLFQLVAQLLDCPSCNTKQICGQLNKV